MRDYFLQPKVWSQTVAFAAEFDPHFSLGKAALLQIKICNIRTAPLGSLRHQIVNVFRHSILAKECSHMSLISVLDELDRVVSLIVQSRTNFCDQQMFPRTPPGHSPLLPLAVLLDVPFWVESLLQRGSPVVSVQHYQSPILPALSYNLRHSASNFIGINDYIPMTQSIKLLLDYGVNPNDTSPFSGKRICQYARELTRQIFGQEVCFDMADAFAQHGFRILHENDILRSSGAGRDRIARVEELLADSCRTKRLNGLA